MQENERLAVLETVSQRNEKNVTELRDSYNETNNEMSKSFGEVKESIIHLRVNSEAMARTQEAVVSQIQDVHKRVGTLETDLQRHKSDAATVYVDFKHEIEKIVTQWNSEKKRLLAYFSGASFVVTFIWVYATQIFTWIQK